MTMPLRYLARRLHLPTGDVQERQVVSVANDGTVEWCPFEAESQSMLLVADLFIENDGNGGFVVSSYLL